MSRTFARLHKMACTAALLVLILHCSFEGPLLLAVVHAHQNQCVCRLQISCLACLRVCMVNLSSYAGVRDAMHGDGDEKRRALHCCGAKVFARCIEVRHLCISLVVCQGFALRQAGGPIMLRFWAQLHTFDVVHIAILVLDPDGHAGFCIPVVLTALFASKSTCAAR